jgi:plastocyanin
MSRRLVAVLAALFLGAPAARADVVGQAAVGPGGSTVGYLTPVVVVQAGGSITFTNLDIASHSFVHDVASDGFGGPHDAPWCTPPSRGKKHTKRHKHGHKGPCPVFYSETIGFGQQTPVLGLENVEAGRTYSFFCTVHHNMKGKLIVR